LKVEILGQVYEQFLGKVIRLTAGHHAVVDEKPEVKKAGGVYYTPAYIVNYIVQNTVGKLLEEIVGRVPSRGETGKTGAPDSDQARQKSTSADDDSPSPIERGRAGLPSVGSAKDGVRVAVSP